MTIPATVTLKGDEVRTYPATQLRATRAGGDADDVESGLFTQLDGRAVPYGEWIDTGWNYEQMAPGVFAKSIKENPQLPLLLFHDNRTWPIGGAREWTETDGGLDGLWDIDDSVEAQRGADLADKRMLTGMSVGFIPSRRKGAEEWVDVETGEPLEGDERWMNPNAGVIVKEARLVETSLTPTPAYAGAQVSLVRSASRHDARARRRRAEEIAEWRRYLQTIRRAS